jgi:hypothetical protein
MTNVRPITPPSQPDSLSAALQSTPPSLGAGSNSGYDRNINVSDYYPYLREDLQNCATIEFEEFLEIILGFKIDAEAAAQARKICERTEFKKRMDKYCEVVADETGRYGRLVELINYVFSQIGLEEIQLCRNDRTLVWGSYAARKPDVLGVRADGFKQGGRLNPDNLSKNGPGDVDAFHWGEVLDFWEFKLVVKSYVEYLKSTGSSRLFANTCKVYPDLLQ